MGTMAQYMNIALHFVVCTFLLCGILVWMQRKENKRPRTYLSVCFILEAIIVFVRLLMTYDVGVPDGYQVLSLLNLYGGLLFLLLLYLYPIEMVNPGWLKGGKMLLLFTPLIVMAVILVVVPFEFRELDSLLHLCQYILEPNVWFRVLMLFACIVPYSLLLLFIPYNWRVSNVNGRWIRDYTIAVQGIGVLYLLFVITGSIFVSMLHLIYVMIFISWVTYQELYLRLISVQTTLPDSSMPVKNIQKPQKIVSNPLWEKLKVHMDEKELWREPDMTLEELSGRLNTNRTTLSSMIQQQGYSGYPEFINRRRIEAFTQALHSGDSTNMQQLFYGVGFRSKSTAVRNFCLYMGCTPSEYIRRVVEKREGS